MCRWLALAFGALALQPWLAAGQAQLHKLKDGCSYEGIKNVTERWAYPNEVANVVCCELDGSRSTRWKGSGNAWTCITGTEEIEWGKRTYSQAFQLCEDMGMRLCANQAELDLSCGTGCNLNEALVWTLEVKVLPTDVPHIVARFQEMQAEINNLTETVSAMEQEVVDVESVAQSTKVGIAQSEGALANATQTAVMNEASILALQGETEVATQEVVGVTKEMDRLQEYLNTLENNAKELTAGQAAMAEKVARLEAEVKEMLPGEGTITTRIADADAKLKGYRQQLQAGDLDQNIARRLRASFRRATSRVEAMTERLHVGADEDDD